MLRRYPRSMSLMGFSWAWNRTHSSTKGWKSQRRLNTHVEKVSAQRLTRRSSSFHLTTTGGSSSPVSATHQPQTPYFPHSTSNTFSRLDAHSAPVHADRATSALDR